MLLSPVTKTIENNEPLFAGRSPRRPIYELKQNPFRLEAFKINVLYRFAFSRSNMHGGTHCFIFSSTTDLLMSSKV